MIAILHLLLMNLPPYFSLGATCAHQVCKNRTLHAEAFQFTSDDNGHNNASTEEIFITHGEHFATDSATSVQ